MKLSSACEIGNIFGRISTAGRAERSEVLWPGNAEAALWKIMLNFVQYHARRAALSHFGFFIIITFRRCSGTTPHYQNIFALS